MGFGKKLKDRFSRPQSGAGPSLTPASQYPPPNQLPYRPYPNPGAPSQYGGQPPAPEVVHAPQIQNHAPNPALVNAGLFRNAADEKTAASDFASAITLYEQAIRLNPEDAEVLLSRAMAYRLSNPPQYQAALRDANAAITCDPTSWYAWHTKGELMGCLDDFDGAEEAFNEAYASATGMDKIKVQTSIGDNRRKRDLANTLPPQVQTHYQSQAPYQAQPMNPPGMTYQQPSYYTHPPPSTHSELPSPSSPSSSYPPPPSIPILNTPAYSNSTYPTPPPQRAPSPYIPPTTPQYTTPSPVQPQPQSWTQSTYQAPSMSPSITQPTSSFTTVSSTPVSAPQNQPDPPPQRTPSISSYAAPPTPSSTSPTPASPQRSSYGATLQPTATPSSPGNAQATAPSLVRPPPSPSIETRTMGTANTTTPAQASSSTSNTTRQPVQRQHNASNVNQTPTTTIPFTPADLSALTEDIPSEPPPDYSPSGNPQQATITTAELNAKLNELEIIIAVKNKGKLMVRPYTGAQQIDAVQLLYVGLTAAQLTTREIPTITYLHPTHNKMHVDINKYPGNTFLDMDPESGSFYDGQLPGTTTVGGYSEEYRNHQLLLAPALNLHLEASVGLPSIPLAHIVSRIQNLRFSRVEDDVGLLSFLGLSQVNTLQFGFGVGGTRQRRIDSLCLMLTRAFYDEPTRFTDFTKARTFTSHFLTSANQETKTRDFLFQMMLGYELLIRLKLQPVLTSYAGIMTDYISTLIVAADLFMQNVQVTTPTSTLPSLTSTTPPRYAFFAANHQRNAEGLIRIAEALSWPLMDETRRCLETAYFDLTSGTSAASYDTYDWLFGLIMPGKFFRHRVMCTLVDASPSIRNWQGAPYYDNGVVVKNKSYWPKRTVLGRILGALRNPKCICGWLGPLPAPSGKDQNGAVIQGWISLNARRLDVPVPIIRHPKPLEALGFTDANPESNEQVINAIVDPNEYIISSGPVAPFAAQKTAFKGIHLELIPQARLAIGASLGLPTEEYRASLDFEVAGAAVKYTLFTLPVFVNAPPCVGTHVMFRRQAQMRLREAVLVKDLKDTYPVPDKLLIINAMGEGDEVVARAWCAERGKHAVVRRDVPGKECCFACACNLAAGDTGLNCNVLIWTK